MNTRVDDTAFVIIGVFFNNEEIDMIEDRDEYRSENGVAAWWQKDGAWHVALPFTPTEQDRKQFSESYPEGDDGPFFRWTADQFRTKGDAIEYIEN